MLAGHPGHDHLERILASGHVPSEAALDAIIPVLGVRLVVHHSVAAQEVLNASCSIMVPVHISETKKASGQFEIKGHWGCVMLGGIRGVSPTRLPPPPLPPPAEDMRQLNVTPLVTASALFSSHFELSRLWYCDHVCA